MTSKAGPLRICFVAHSAYGEMAGGRRGDKGGIQRQQSLMARWLVARGHDVRMITWDEGQGADEVVIDGVRVFRVCREDEGLPGLRFFHPRWTSLLGAFRRADAEVYYHNAAEYVTGQVALWTRRAGRKFVFSTAHDTDCDAQFNRTRSLRERLLDRHGLTNADRVISQTRIQQQMLRDQFGLDSVVIPMPCPPAAPGARARHPGSGPVRVLWVGRIASGKRLEMLLDVAEAAPDLHFDVAGGPTRPTPYSDEVLARAARIPNVTLHGRVERERMPALYEGAAFLCCTSTVEGFPNTFLEAWSVGLPVVSTFDPDHLIAERGLGATAQDAPGLLREMRALLASPDAWRSAAEQSLRYFNENHLPEVTMGRFERVFLEASGRGEV